MAVMPGGVKNRKNHDGILANNKPKTHAFNCAAIRFSTSCHVLPASGSFS
jgi:hypothetical protein